MSERVEAAINELNAALSERLLNNRCGCRSAGHECGRVFVPEHPEEEGLVTKFVVLKASGEPVDPGARYFVLRYDKQDAWGVACRAALEVVAQHCEGPGLDLPALADDLRRAIGKA